MLFICAVLKQICIYVLFVKCFYVFIDKNSNYQKCIL